MTGESSDYQDVEHLNPQPLMVKPEAAAGASGPASKPPHSYIALISMAILSRPDRRMLLCDIYQYIMDNFSYYNSHEKAWRNSIRHNLSLNECFIKTGRADNGKGNYWSIHPACEEDFSKGDFRRRQARRRARKNVKENNIDAMVPSRYNYGYVPMTQSHINYSPYGSSAMPWYYPPSNSSMGPYSPVSSKPPFSPIYTSNMPHQSLSPSSLFSPCSLNATQPPVAASAAANRFFMDQVPPASQFSGQTFGSLLSSGM